MLEIKDSVDFWVGSAIRDGMVQQSPIHTEESVCRARNITLYSLQAGVRIYIYGEEENEVSGDPIYKDKVYKGQLLNTYVVDKVLTMLEELKENKIDVGNAELVKLISDRVSEMIGSL